MSLVNEALKKARLEAARQDAARRGLPMPGAQLAGGSRVGSQTLVRVGTIGAVALLALLLFLAGRRFGSVEEPQTASIESRRSDAEAASPGQIVPPPEPQTSASRPTGGAASSAGPPDTASSGRAPAPEPLRASPSTGQAEPPPPSAMSRTELSRPSGTQPAPTVAAPPEKRSERVPARTADGSPPTAGDGSQARTPSPGADRRRPQAETRVRIVTPTAPAQPAGGEPPQTAVRVLELPGAVRIELGGIAWSEQRPFALLNGRVVGPGDVVESLAVVAVARRHVELQGEAGHFLLRLK